MHHLKSHTRHFFRIAIHAIIQHHMLKLVNMLDTNLAKGHRCNVFRISISAPENPTIMACSAHAVIFNTGMVVEA